MAYTTGCKDNLKNLIMGTVNSNSVVVQISDAFINDDGDDDDDDDDKLHSNFRRLLPSGIGMRTYCSTGRRM